MISFKNFGDQLVSKTLTSAFGLLFTDSLIKNGRRPAETKIPDDFSPVLRFAAVSDIHLDGDENQAAAKRFGELFKDMYSYSDGEEYKSLDAVMVAGDFTGGGAEKQYEMFLKVVKENIKEETALLTVLGNHEFIDYRDEDATVGYKVYKKYISEDIDTHTVINGYHFIGVSYDDDGKSFTRKTDWLRSEIEKAVREDNNKPVFVFQHPAPTATIYGSINWGDADVRKVLNGFPQVIDFSGHSHYAPMDPRSVWQGAFTAVGCGSLAAFMGNLNYIDGDKDAPGESGGFLLVEADEKGRVRIRIYDIVNHKFFPDCEYFFTDIADTKKRTYTWHKNKAADTAPGFGDGEVFIKKDGEGNSVLVFPEAEGIFPAENYKIKITDSSGKTVFENTVISGYVRADSVQCEANLGKLTPGKYKAVIKAYSPYAKHGGTIKKNLEIK